MGLRAASARGTTIPVSGAGTVAAVGLGEGEGVGDGVGDGDADARAVGDGVTAGGLVGDSPAPRVGAEATLTAASTTSTATAATKMRSARRCERSGAGAFMASSQDRADEGDAHQHLVAPGVVGMT